ncbi:MAG: tyrosine-protein phosphatase [Clostridiales bacterium]|nr:tyrosine-protein phosphatase [Clostridiales bacterium]
MILNKRDLGGISAAGNSRVKNNMLIRSGDLSKAEPDDLIGVSVVIDLRTPDESAEKPDITYGAEYRSMPFFTESTPGISHESDDDTPDIPDLNELYGSLIKNCTEQLKRIMSIIMTHDFRSGAVLWHCTEGKDRSGIVTALILEALGVSRDEIVLDYLKTNLINIPKAEHLKEQLKGIYGPEFADKVYRAMIADESYLKSAWTQMGKNYLEETLGISGETVQRFRSIVLEEL